LATAPLRGDEADDQYAIAAGHYAQKRWKLAAETFEAFLEIAGDHPKASQANFWRGEALLQLGQIETARACFGRYLESAPEGPHARPARFRAAETAFLAGDHQGAQPLLEDFLDRHPQDKLGAYVLGYLAEIRLDKGEGATAESYYRRVLAEFPESNNQDKYRFGLARALEKQGKRDEAERLFLAVAAETDGPLADDAQFQLGALRYSMGKYEGTINSFEAFETRLKDSPWRPMARLGRGWALVKLDRLDEATKCFQSITGNPQVGVEARYWLGLVRNTQEDWDSAAQTFLEAAEIDPGHRLLPAVRVHAGHALLRTGDMAGAAEQFALAAAFSSEENQWLDDAIHGQVQAALTAKDHRRVDQYVKEFLRRFSDSPLRGDVRRMLAQSFIERKQFADAIGLLEPDVADSSPSAEQLESRYLLALAYEGTDRAEDALNMLGPVLEASEREFHSDAQLTQASLLVGLKRYSEAVKPLQDFLATEPTEDLAVKGLGQLAISYARTDRLDQAKSAYNRLLSEYPQHHLLTPITEQVAEAAYDAGDLSWSGELFGWLAEKGHSTQSERKGLAGLAWSQFNAGELEAAAATFDELLKKGPDAALASEASLARGQILQQLGRHDEALGMYDSVIERYRDTPQHPQALLAAAGLRDQLGQDEAAARLYERTTKEYPESDVLDSILYQWAWTLKDLDCNDEADALFRRIYDQHPNSGYWADATYRLADYAYGAGDIATCKEMIRAVLDGEPDDLIRQNALLLQGQAASAEEKWAEAAQAFEMLIDEHPDSEFRLRAQYGKGEAEFRQGNFQAAASQFQQTVDETLDTSQPWFAVFHVRLAQSLAELKKWNEALAVASKIEERFPGYEEQYEVDYVIGQCLGAQADFEGAREHYRKVYRSPQGDKTQTAAKARFMIAESFFHQKDYEAALREYLALEILYAYPVLQAAALLQAGKCYEQLGEWNEAIKQYTRLLDVYGETEYGKEATERLPQARQMAQRG
jgi:TolA-binding protein